jgi:adenylate cyclase
MNRRTIVALVLGAIVAAIVIVLHATGVTLALEDALMSLFPGAAATTWVFGVKAQYALVIFVALGATWLVVQSTRRKRLVWPLAIFAIELLVVAWVCSLFRVFFQPLPSLLALGLGVVAGNGYAAFAGRSRKGDAYDFFTGRLSEAQLSRLSSGSLRFDRDPKSYEVTAVVCDIANKHDLAEECSPAEFGELTQRFIEHVTSSCMDAGAYIEAANGEGVVAIFGFPGGEEDQAEKATRHALALLASAATLRVAGKNEALANTDVHIGISSGSMIAAPLQRNGSSQLLAAGEPVELARRFCIANRFYGSRILIGPRTFEYCSRTILARPIDFLSGVDVRERHEIYEPLRLAADATPAEIERRDSFWQGVVLYREKRWAEAYAQFQKAHGGNEDEDAPLQLYLRRIEPLALQLAMSDDD